VSGGRAIACHRVGCILQYPRTAGYLMPTTWPVAAP
jgi:hypothetical protein